VPFLLVAKVTVGDSEENEGGIRIDHLHNFKVLVIKLFLGQRAFGPFPCEKGQVIGLTIGHSVHPAIAHPDVPWNTMLVFELVIGILQR
jgi:hypothetical protein